MKNHIAKKRKKLGFGLIIFFIATICLMNIFFIDTNDIAKATETNTYYQGRSTTLSRDWLKSRTKSSQNNNAPSMTILTHGLGGDASHWSNDGMNFAYDEQSLIERLRDSVDNAFVYWAGIDSKNDNGTYNYYLREQSKDYYDNKRLEGSHKNNIASITQEDAEKHLIIIFEDRQDKYTNSSGAETFYNMQSNEDAYDELDYVIDSLLYDLQNYGANNPRVNLIGHSRGGILNMMYANEHPYNVDSIFSMGTPYNGSKSSDLLNVISEMDFDLGENVDIQELFNTVTSQGGQDIMNEELFNNLKNSWNQTISINPSINAHTLATAMNISFLEDIANISLDLFDTAIKLYNAENLNVFLDLAKDNSEKIDKLYKGYSGNGLSYDIQLIGLLDQINKAKNIYEIFTILHNKTELIGIYDADFVEEIETYYDLLTLLEFTYLVYVITPYDEFISLYKNTPLEGIDPYYIFGNSGDNATPIVQVENLYLPGYIEPGKTEPSSCNFSQLLEKNGININTIGIEDIFEKDSDDLLVFLKENLKKVAAIGLDSDTIIGMKNGFNNRIPYIENLPYYRGVAYYIISAILLYPKDGFEDNEFLLAFKEALYEFCKDVKLERKTHFHDNNIIYYSDDPGGFNNYIDLKFWKDDIIFLNDLFVDFDSQSALDYNGFQRVYKLYDIDYEYIYRFSNTSLPIPIPHNLETRDPDFIDYILGNIDIGEFSLYKTRKLYSGGLEIYGFNLGGDFPEIINIPETIDGRSITKIGKEFSKTIPQNVATINFPKSINEIDTFAFHECKNVNIEFCDNPYYCSYNEDSNIGYCIIYNKEKTELIKYIPFQEENENVILENESVFLLDCVEKINDYAFYGCEITNVDSGSDYSANSLSLQNIGRFAFANCSKLELFAESFQNLNCIEESAFLECTSLQRFELCDNLLSIGSNAFYNCSSLEDSCIPKNVNSIGERAFFGCSGITKFTVDEDNEYFQNGLCDADNDGYIDDNDGIIYNKTESGTATEIVAYPIGKTDETYIIPDGIIEIGDYAFYGVTSLYNIIFSETVEIIGSGAFADCESLDEIILPESIKEIEIGAFYDCDELLSIIFTQLNCPKIGYCVFPDNTNFKIYVPKFVLSYYKEELYQYKDIIFPNVTQVIFMLDETTQYETKELDYYSIMGEQEFPINPVKDNYEFLGWYDEANTNYTSSDENNNIIYGNQYELYDTMKNIGICTLYALWEPQAFLIEYNDNEIENTNELRDLDCLYGYNTEKKISFVPKKIGYQFSGWYSDENFSNVLPKDDDGNYYINSNVFDEVYDENESRIILFPKFSPIEYSITIEENQYVVEYKTKMQFLDELSPQNNEPGHVFIGWSYEDVVYTETNNYWNFPVDAELIAVWKPIDTVVFLNDENERISINITFGDYFPNKPNLKPCNKEGYTFEGYFERRNGQGKQYYDENMNGIRKNDFEDFFANVYVYWKPNEYTVTLNHNNGTENSNIFVEYNEELPSLQKPVLLGYDFIGYFNENGDCYYNSDMESQRKWQFTENGFLEAQWELAENHIILNNTNLASIPYKMSLEDRIFCLERPDKDGFEFLGWFDAEVDGIQIDNVIIEANTFPTDINVYAYWELEYYYAYNGDNESTMFTTKGDDIFSDYLINLDDFSESFGQVVTGCTINNKQYIKKIVEYDSNNLDYEKNDMVFYNSNIYECISSLPNDECISLYNDDYWNKVTTSYSSTNSYNSKNIVEYNDEFYQCIEDCSDCNIENNEYWKELGDNIGYWTCNYNYLMDATIEPIRKVMFDEILINFDNAPSEKDKIIIGWGEGNNKYIKKVLKFDPLNFDYKEEDKVFYNGILYEYINTNSLSYTIYPDETANDYWVAIMEDYYIYKVYEYGNLVKYNEKIYQCIKDSINTHYPTNTEYWQELGENVGYFNNEFEYNEDYIYEPIWEFVGEKLFINIDEIPEYDNEIVVGWENNDINYIKRVLNFNPKKLDYCYGDIVYIGETLHVNTSYDSPEWMEIDITEYNDDEWFGLGDLVRYNNKLYQCIKDSVYKHSIDETEYWQEIKDFGYWNCQYEYQSIDINLCDELVETKYYAIAFYDANDNFIGYYNESSDTYIVDSLSKEQYYIFNKSIPINGEEDGEDRHIINYFEDSSFKQMENPGYIYEYVYKLDEENPFENKIGDFTEYISGKGVGIIELKVKWHCDNYDVNRYINDTLYDTINVTYNSFYYANDAIIIENENAEFQQKYNLYNFIGWYDNPAFLGDPITSETKVTKVTTHNLFACFEMQIDIDNDNGEDLSNTIVAYNKIMPSLNKPVKSGYKFLGYNFERFDEDIQDYIYIQQYYNENMESYNENMESYNEDMEILLWDELYFENDNYRLLAIWIPIEYNISYQLYVGSFIEGVEYPCTYTIESTYNSEDDTLPPVGREGYDFKYWYTHPLGYNGNYNYNIENQIDELSNGRIGNIPLWPKFEAKVINVKLNPNVISLNEPLLEDIPEDLNITIDSYNDIECIPETEHYNFIGWYFNDFQITDSEGCGVASWSWTEYEDENLIATLEAKWEPKKYKIDFNNNNGHGISYKIVEYNDYFPDNIRTPKRDCYIFTGYFYNDIQVYDSSMEMLVNEKINNFIDDYNEINLTAHWETIEYNINYYADYEHSYNYSCAHTDTITIEDIEDYTLYIPNEKNGYIFDGWLTNRYSNEKIIKVFKDTLLNGNLNFYSKWKKIVNTTNLYRYDIYCDSYVIMDNRGEDDRYYFYIEEGASEVEFIGNIGNQYYENFKIIIKSRNEPITIKLNNMHVLGITNNIVIDSTRSSEKLIIECENTNEIRGGMKNYEKFLLSTIECSELEILGNGLEIYGAQAKSYSSKSISGGIGIICTKLEIENSALLVRGGNGNIGINGSDGKNGRVNGYPYDLGIAKAGDKVLDGGDGTSGTDGTDAGCGGIGIVCFGDISGLDSTTKVYGGDGGYGGHGGKGGNGQDGQDGNDGVWFGATAKAGGDGGNAGHGGSGGDAGAGGSAIYNTYEGSWEATNEIINGESGTPGAAGANGKIGTGGIGGETVFGNKKDNGTNGLVIINEGEEIKPGKEYENLQELILAILYQ